jgi:hypothetical protein
MEKREFDFPLVLRTIKVRKMFGALQSIVTEAIY